MAIRLLVYLLEQGQEAKTQSRELRGWGSGGADASTYGTKEHPATLPQPTRSQTQKNKGRGEGCFPHPMWHQSASLRGPARGI